MSVVPLDLGLVLNDIRLIIMMIKYIISVSMR